MVLARKHGWIGIELGPRALKLAQTQRSRGGLRVSASVVMPRTRTAQSVLDTTAEDCGWTSREISAALARGGFSGRKAACTLPMCVSDLNVLRLPPGAISERRAMVVGELSSMFAEDQRQREFDFWESASAAATGSANAGEVNVLSVPRTLVSQAADGISGARLSCKVMDGLPFALARAVELAATSGRTPPTAAVHWDFASATFCVASGGKPLFTRHLRNCGTGLLVGAVADALGFSEDETMQVLAKYGLPGPEGRDGNGAELQEVLVEVAASQLNEITEELKKTISYLQAQHSAIVPGRLCLFAEGAAIRNITTYVSEKAGIATEAWRLPCSENHGGTIQQNHPALLGTAVALSALAWVS